MRPEEDRRQDDMRLCQRLRAREQPAFETVVDQHYHPLYRQLYYLTGNAEQAADLTQLTFVEAWKSLRSFQGRSSLRTWLHTIAVRVWWRQQKRDGKMDTDPLLESMPAGTPDPHTAALAAVEWSHVSCAVTRLPPIYRSVIVLSYLEEMSHTEIAAALSIPVGTVKSRLQEAMHRLRRMLSHLEET